jgi:hypothetical protein
MKPEVNPLRLLIKTLVLFVVINLCFAVLNLPVGKLSIFNHLIPGRVRFNAERTSSDLSASGVLVFDDLDAMFASHVISNGPKPANEYRIILLGDSSVWGFEIPPQETLSEQINRLGLQTCDGRQIKAYNLSYPLPSNTRDLITLEKALDFQPDLVVWLVTLKTFDSTTAEKDLLIPQSERVLNLVNRYHIKVDAQRFLHPPSFWDKTIVGSSTRLKKITLEQFYGLLLAETGIDVQIPDPDTVPQLSENVDASTLYNVFSISDQRNFGEQLDFTPITAAQEIAGKIPLVIVNEPIFRAQGENSDLRYNKYYPRWAYDQFRLKLTAWMLSKNQPLVDFWNDISNNKFIGTPLHLNPAGEHDLAQALAPKLSEISCSKK